MKHFLKTRKTLSILLAVLFIATTAFASGIFNRDDQDIYSGVWRIWKQQRFMPTSTITLETGMTFTGNNIIDASDIADQERQMDLPLVAAFIDGTGIIGNDGTTAPGIAETDNIPAIVWASNEVTPVQWTFRLPSTYSTGLGFRVLCSESSDTTNSTIGWQIWVNKDGIAFDAAAVAHTAVALANSASTNEVVALVVNATGLTQATAGAWVTLDIWNTTTGNGSLEVKGVQEYHTSTI